jgi:hypothetical protein
VLDGDDRRARDSIIAVTCAVWSYVNERTNALVWCRSIRWTRRRLIDAHCAKTEAPVEAAQLTPVS